MKNTNDIHSLEEGLIAAPLRAIPGDLVRVDRDKNLLADPNEFGSWENFEKAVNNSGLELSWDYGTDREGWRVEAKVPDNHIVDEDDEDYEDENNF